MIAPHNRYRMRLVRLAMLWELLVDKHESCSLCTDGLVECSDVYRRIGAVDYEMSKYVG
jgi:hypothetical protein